MYLIKMFFVWPENAHKHITYIIQIEKTTN